MVREGGRGGGSLFSGCCCSLSYVRAHPQGRSCVWFGGFSRPRPCNVLHLLLHQQQSLRPPPARLPRAGICVLCVWPVRAGRAGMHAGRHHLLLKDSVDGQVATTTATTAAPGIDVKRCRPRVSGRDGVRERRCAAVVLVPGRNVCCQQEPAGRYVCTYVRMHGCVARRWLKCARAPVVACRQVVRS